MKYSIVIPSLANEQTKPYLELCVRSLRDSGFDGDVIVVTNGEHGEPLKIPGVTRRLHTRDQGQCNATNIGVSTVTTDWAMVSNDDMYYAPGWDKNLRFNYPIFSPNLVEPENNLGSAPPFLKVNAGYTLEEFNKKPVNDLVKLANRLRSKPDKNVKDDLRPKGTQEYTTLWDESTWIGDNPEEPGFNLPFIIRKDFWDFLGGYDTAFDPWGSNSDTDLQTRINEAGVIPMRLRDVLVYHFSNKSGTFDGTHQDFYANNIEYFRSKHGFDRDELGSDVWYNKDMLPKDKSKIKYKQRKYEG